MTSVSVSLSESCTVHLSGTGSDAYLLSSMHSVSSPAVGGILASIINRTAQIVSLYRSFSEIVDNRRCRRSETCAIVVSLLRRCGGATGRVSDKLSRGRRFNSRSGTAYNDLRQFVYNLAPLSRGSISWYGCKHRKGNSRLWKR